MAIDKKNLNIKSQEELLKKLIEKQENTLKSLAERQTDVIKSLLQEQIEEGRAYRDSQGRFAKDSRKEMLARLDTLPGLAQSISQNLGMEKGSKRILEDRLAEMAFVNKDVRDALVKGDAGDVKGKMIGILTDQLKEMKGLSEEEKTRHQMLIDELDKQGENMFDWEKIGNRADNIFFPLTQKFWEVAEGIRGAAQEIPVLGRFFTEDMVEHYRQGISKANEIFGGHVQTILQPIDALVGPIKGIAQGGWQIFKTLASGPSTYEKETAKYTRLTYQATKEGSDEQRKAWMERKRQWFDQKKQWVVEKKDRAKELFQSARDKASGIYEKGKSGLGKLWEMLKKIGPMLFSAFSVVGSFVTGTLLPAIPVIAGLIALGVTIGKIATNLFNDAGELGRMLMDGDFAGFARLFAADLLDGLLFLPEMIVNGILSLFTDFRVDFGKDAILTAIDSMTAWVFDNITVPVMDFFTITIPQAFSDLGNTLTNWFMKVPEALSGMFTEMVDGLVNLFSNFSIENLGIMIWNNVVNMLKVATAGIPIIGDKIGEALDGVKGTMNTGEDVALSTSKVPTASTPSTTSVSEAKAAAVKEQVAVQKEVQKELKTTNTSLVENTEAQQNIINNIIASQPEKKDEIPTDVHDLGIMFNNSVYGA